MMLEGAIIVCNITLDTALKQLSQVLQLAFCQQIKQSVLQGLGHDMSEFFQMTVQVKADSAGTIKGWNPNEFIYLF